MSDETDDTRGTWVPALVIQSPATPKQRARNYALYARLRDGTPPEQRTGSRDGVGLHVFVFEVPIERCSIEMRTVTFRLDKSDECYRRLLSYISDHFPTKCDADHSVDELRKMLRHALDLFDAHPDPHVIVKDAFAEMRAQLDAFESQLEGK